MKCDHCDQDAVVHEVVIKGGAKKEIHLCDKHANEHGYVIPMQQPLNQLLTKFVISQGPGTSEPRKSASTTCRECGMTFAQFRQSGTLGCATCYDTFGQALSTVIERAQGGATHHVGKSPQRAGHSIDRQLLRQRIVKELEEAVVAEQYERAAQLRDRLSSLDISADTPEKKAPAVKRREEKESGS